MEYYEIIIQFAASAYNDHFVTDFYGLLKALGFCFEKGYWRAEGMTLLELVNINQRYLGESRLEDRYKYNIVENGSQYNGLFSYCSFTRIRGFWDVYNDDHDFFSFKILIPEEDLCRYERGKLIREEDRMKALIDLSIEIWGNVSVKIIQTMWECSNVPLSFAEINHNNPPQAEPFAIISKEKYDKDWNYHTTSIGRMGVLMEDDNNWFPV